MEFLEIYKILSSISSNPLTVEQLQNMEEHFLSED